MPDRVVDQARQTLTTQDEVERIRRGRIKLESEKDRLGKMFQAGGIEENCYLRELSRVMVELSELIEPEQIDVTAAAELLNSFSIMWRGALASERSEMLQTLLRYVTVDVDAKTVTCLAPKNEFAALFKAAIQLLNADSQFTEVTGVASSRDVKPIALDHWILQTALFLLYDLPNRVSSIRHVTAVLPGYLHIPFTGCASRFGYASARLTIHLAMITCSRNFPAREGLRRKYRHTA